MINALGQRTILQGYQSLITNQFSILIRGSFVVAVNFFTASGVVGSSYRLSEVERTTPAAPPKERDHLLGGAASPLLPRRGLRLSRRLFQTRVSRGRLVGNAQLTQEWNWNSRFASTTDLRTKRE